MKNSLINTPPELLYTLIELHFEMFGMSRAKSIKEGFIDYLDHPLPHEFKEGDIVHLNTGYLNREAFDSIFLSKKEMTKMLEYRLIGKSIPKVFAGKKTNEGDDFFKIEKIITYKHKICTELGGRGGRKPKYIEVERGKLQFYAPREIPVFHEAYFFETEEQVFQSNRKLFTYSLHGSSQASSGSGRHFMTAAYD